MRKEMREATIYDFPRTTKVVKKAGSRLANFGKSLWEFAKPFAKEALDRAKVIAKKFVQKAVRWLHGMVFKLEEWLLDKIDEVEILDEIPE